MSVQIGQIVFNIFPVESQPGALYDNRPTVIQSFCAAEQIFPGRCVELASDNQSIQMVQATSTTLNVIGISLLESAKEGFGSQDLSTAPSGVAYQPGDMVPVLVVGAVFAEWLGTTQPVWPTAANVYHSSTLAVNRGKFTDTATSTTTGAEVAAAPKYIAALMPARSGTGNIIGININWPGAIS